MEANVGLTKGLIPPQAVDVEKTVLGAMMIDSNGLWKALEILSDDTFYVPAHKEIFQSMKMLSDSSRPVDLITISQELSSRDKLEGVGGNVYLINLSQAVGSAANIEYHSRILQQKFIRRKLIELSMEISRRAYDDKEDVFDVLDSAGSYFDGVNDQLSSSYESSTWESAIASIPKHVEFLSNKGDQLTGLPTGLSTVDKHFSGWQPTDFIVIGADSGMGKTAFVTTNMIAAAKAGCSVGMFSMEMSVKQLAIRGIAIESSFHINQLMRSGFEKQEYFSTLWEYVNQMKSYPIHIDDRPALTVPEMKRKARSMKRKYGIKLLVIDFLQMFSGDKDIRINVGEAARQCKNIAKELNIPVIGLSQISRDVHRSQYKLPGKQHLKEASAIEEAADVIGMLYRPDYYGFTYADNARLWEDELGLRGEENAVLRVVKNRNGSLGNVPLVFEANKAKYIDVSSD